MARLEDDPQPPLIYVGYLEKGPSSHATKPVHSPSFLSTKQSFKLELPPLDILAGRAMGKAPLWSLGTIITHYFDETRRRHPG